MTSLIRRGCAGSSAGLATSTHDTQRSEDVRLKIALLSEIPEQWAALSAAWMQRARSLSGGDRVDPRTLYFLLQTLVGAHPISLERLQVYLVEAARGQGVDLLAVPGPAARAELPPTICASG